MELLTPEDIAQIARLIESRYGYDFREYAISSFTRRVTRVMEIKKLKTVEALLQKLNSPSFFQEFISEITVNVTEMFRDPGCWIALRNEVLPTLFKQKKHIRIWLAGCSSGEEAFSLVITLTEMGLLDQIELIATDIDEVIIKKARKNFISEKNMEVNRKNYHIFGGKSLLDHYFFQASTGYLFKDEYLSMINFLEHDLVKGQPYDNVDLVLCRNVMIYFSQELQNKVLNKIHQGLNKFGYLVIGSKESLIWCDISQKFMTVNNEEKIYKKVKE